MEADSVLHQQLPSAYRSLQPQATQALQHGQPHLAHHSLASQTGLDLSGLDEADAVFQQDLQRLQNAGHAQVFHTPTTFHPNPGQRHLHPQANGSPHTPQQHGNAPQFGILTTGSAEHNAITRLHQNDDMFGSPEIGDHKGGGLLGTAIVTDPPDLEEWRQKLFDVNEMITLSEEEFAFPGPILMQIINGHIGFKPTFLMSIMSIPIDQHNGTSESLSSLIIGIAD